MKVFVVEEVGRRKQASLIRRELAISSLLGIASGMWWLALGIAFTMLLLLVITVNLISFCWTLTTRPASLWRSRSAGPPMLGGSYADSIFRCSESRSPITTSFRSASVEATILPFELKKKSFLPTTL